MNVVIGVITTLSGALLIGAWNAKEGTSQHTADIQDVRAERRAQIDSVNHRVDMLTEMALETLCEVKPQSRHCK